MCLGVPGRIVSMDGDAAEVDFWGVTREVRLDVVDQPVRSGDYVLVHVGFALRRIPTEEIAATLSLYEELLASEAELDPMADDVRAERDAGGGVRRDA